MTCFDQLVCVAVDHTTADRNTRRLAAMDDKQRDQVAASIYALPTVSDMIILTTCNRIEVYALAATATAHEATESIADVLSSFVRDRLQHRCETMSMLKPDKKLMDEIGLSLAERPQPFDALAYQAKAEADVREFVDALRFVYREEAATRLVELTMGLRSALLGDTKISGQVRAAHKRSLRTRQCRTGSVLDQLCRAAMSTLPEVYKVNRSALMSAFQFRSLGAAAGMFAGIDAELRRKTYRMRSNALILGTDQSAEDAAISFGRHPANISFYGDEDRVRKLAETVTRAHLDRADLSVSDSSRFIDHHRPDVIICTEAVDEHLDTEQISSISQERWRAHELYSELSPDDFLNLIIIDSTDGLVIDKQVAELKHVSYFSSIDIARHFQNAVDSTQEAVEAARETAAAVLNQLECEHEIKTKIKQISIRIDEQMRAQVARVYANTELSITEQARLAENARKRAQQKKHAHIVELKRAAGLQVRSRELLAGALT